MNEPSQPPAWRRDFALVVLGTFLVALAFFFLLPVMPLLVVGPLGGAEAQVGLAVGTFSITALAARPFVGWLLDRFGRRLWLLGGAVVMVPCMATYALVPSFAWLEGLRLVHGLAWGLATVAMATVAADLVPSRWRGTGMGIYGLAMPLAMSLGPMLGSFLLGDPDLPSFALVFWVGTGITALATVAYLGVRVPPVRDASARLVVRDMVERRVVPISIVQTLLCAGFGGWMTFLPLYASELGFDSAGPLFFWYAVGGLSSRIFAGRWYDLRGPVGPAALTVLLLLGGWLGFALSTHSAVVVVASLLLGLGFGTAGTVFLAMAIDLVEPFRRGAANATFFSAYDVGIGGGAMLFGALVALEDVQLVFWAAAACTVVGAALLAGMALPHFARSRLGGALAGD
jgi:MFS family permease